jgi:hypothetical protein
MSEIAIITGDIVNSSVLDAREFSFLQEKINGYKHPSIIMGAQFYRGDSFQLAVMPYQALWLALKYRTDVKRWRESCDIRISIGIADVSELNENILISTGNAFELSGKNLDLMKNKPLNLVITTLKEELNRELETYCFLIDLFLREMTFAQANIIYLKLDGITQKGIGKILGISQPAVSKGLNAAKWEVIEKILARYNYLIGRYYGIDE